VWTPAMLQCSRCLSTVTADRQPEKRTDLRKNLSNATGLPLPQSFWIASIKGTPDVLQVVENGVRLPGYRETYPFEQVNLWILPVWSPEMAYCPGCAQAKPRREMLFFFRNPLKGVCKSCSEHFEADAAHESDNAVSASFGDGNTSICGRTASKVETCLNLRQTRMHEQAEGGLEHGGLSGPPAGTHRGRVR